jgi:hypothetical protein
MDGHEGTEVPVSGFERAGWVLMYVAIVLGGLVAFLAVIDDDASHADPVGGVGIDSPSSYRKFVDGNVTCYRALGGDPSCVYTGPR